MPRVLRRGDENLARTAFRQALALDSSLDVKGLDRLSPQLAQLFQQERQAAVRKGFVYVSGSVDESPRCMSAPPVEYPPALLRRHVQGFVEVAAIIDTAGRVEPASVEVLRVVRGSVYRPARSGGRPVRTIIRQAISFVNY